jgi:hypothetical protein
MRFFDARVIDEFGPRTRSEQLRHHHRGAEMTAPTNTLRELDRRTGDGIDVQLLWDARTGRVSIAVADVHTGEVLQFSVDGRDALDAFHHPYAYAVRDRPLSSVTPSRG